MGVWSWMKSLIGPSATPDAPQYGRLPDEELLALWQVRGDLTDVARSALHAELKQRELLPKKKRRGPRGAGTILIAPPEAKFDGEILKVEPGLGILLRTTPGRWAFVHLPLWNPKPPELPSDIALDAIIVCNDERRGWLWTTKLQDKAGLPPERVFSIADGPIDRSVGASGGSAEQLPARATLGLLRLERTASGHALRARWRDTQVEAIVGALLEPGGQPLYVGSLPPPDETMAWRATLQAAHATALMSIAGMAKGRHMNVLILGDAVGAHPDSHGLRELGLGVRVIGKACPVPIDAIAALGSISADRWDLVTEQLRIEGVARDIATHFFVEGELDVAARVLEIAKEASNADLSSLEATLEALRGDVDAAISRREERLASKERDAEALADLAMLLASRGDFEASNRHARAVIAEMSEWFSHVTACRALWMAGAGDEARAALERASVGIRATLVVPVEELLAETPPSAPSRPAFPALAEDARARARRAGDEAEAQRYLRRARELD